MKQYAKLITGVIGVICCIILYLSTNASGSLTEGKNFLSKYMISKYSVNTKTFPTNEANTVLQTSDGYMWFGTYNGLIRYDGMNFTIWNAISEDGFGSSNIRCLYEDGDGILWIGTNDRGLVKRENGIFTTYDKDDGILSNSIRTIIEGEDGRIYCGTTEGIFYFDKSKDKVVNVELNIDESTLVESMACDDGNIYMVLNTGSVWAYTKDKKTIKYDSPILFDAVACDSLGNVIMAARKNDVVFARLEDGEFDVKKKMSTILTDVMKVYEDKQGYVWIVAENGVAFFDSMRNCNYLDDADSSGYYTDIVQDYEDGYWITSSKGGITKLTVSPFRNENYISNIEVDTVNAVIMLKGNKYIATDTGLQIIDVLGEQVKNDITEMLEGIRIRSLYIDSNEDVWISTYAEYGVIRYSPESGEYKNWTSVDGLETDKTRCVLELPNGIMAIATSTGANFIKNDRVVSASAAFDTKEHIEMPDIMVLSMAYMPDGTLYLGTDGSGIYAISKEGSKRYTLSDGLNGEVILRLTKDSEGTGVWVSTSNGLCHVDENGQSKVIDKVPPYSYFDIISHNDELILLTSNIIIRMNENDLLNEDICEPVVINVSSDSNGTNNANSWNWIDKDERLYICCSNGLKSLGLTEHRINHTPFAGLSSIEIDGVTYYDCMDEIIIPNDAVRITFRIAYLSYGLENEAVLKYQLSGQDAGEITIEDVSGGIESISYTNLHGGKYDFHLWTENEAGEQGNEINVTLKKNLTLFEYKTTWLVIIGLAILISVIPSINFEGVTKLFKKKTK